MPDGEYEVRYHPLFHTDVVSAANWYDRHKVGLLGKRTVSTVLNKNVA